MPQPSAAIMVLISSLPDILSKRAFSTLRIFPLIGRSPGTGGRGPVWPTRLRSRLRRCRARSGQDRAPGNRPACREGLLLSSAPFRRTRSRALRAASRARAASTALLMMRRATFRFSSRYTPSLSLTTASTMPLTSVFPSFVLVCPSNRGRGILNCLPILFSEGVAHRNRFKDFACTVVALQMQDRVIGIVRRI